MSKKDSPESLATEEPIVVPDDAARADAPPAWMLEQTSEPKPEAQDNDASDMADAILEIVKDAHHSAAEATHYDKFELPEGMAKNWLRLLRIALKKLPGKDWPILIAAFALVMGYVMMFSGYMKYRKETRIGSPTAAPAVAA